MRLHVLPPAFGLPSIDAECNAAVALLQLHLENDFDIVPTHSVGKRLPSLIDGQTQVLGFNGIVRHLAKRGLSIQEDRQNPQTRADSSAVASFVEAHAQTLLDLSLYVSFENYRNVTRPAFTKVLPWYANYIIPPHRRSAARSRTEHLGISSIDVDNVHEDTSDRPPSFDSVVKEQEFEAATQKRASLLLPRKETVRSLLQRPEHAAIFRLHALADNFFQPLQDLLEGDKHILGQDDLHAVDCLVYGYLSLMLFPKVPQDWLASTLNQKYSRLAEYVRLVHQRLALETYVDTVSATIECGDKRTSGTHKSVAKTSLRWHNPSKPSAFEIMRDISSSIIDQIPAIGAPHAMQLLHAPRRSALQRHLSTLLMVTAGSSIALTYLALRIGWLVWPHGEEVHIFGRRRLADYGHLGAALAGIGLSGSSIRQGMQVE